MVTSDTNSVHLVLENISGSQQFSESNLPLLIKSIGTSLPIDFYNHSNDTIVAQNSR